MIILKKILLTLFLSLFLGSILSATSDNSLTFQPLADNENLWDKSNTMIIAIHEMELRATKIVKLKKAMKLVQKDETDFESYWRACYVINNSIDKVEKWQEDFNNSFALMIQEIDKISEDGNKLKLFEILLAYYSFVMADEDSAG